MKNLVFILLISLVLVTGCSKKYAKTPEVKETESKSVQLETDRTDEKAEVVKDITVPEEQDIQDSSLPVSAKGDDLFMANDVLFDYDKYTIREDARAGLNTAASYLRNKSQVNIVIEGHCDERGTNEYNLALGEKRAKAVKNYFAALGVSPSRISNITYGEEKPVCTEQNDNCWQKNRRARIVVQ